MAQDLVIGIDVGGQTAKCGVVDARGNIVAQTVISSENTTNADEFVAALAEALNRIIVEAKAEGSIRGIGVGIPNGGNIPFAKMLQEQMNGIPVSLTNDANAAAMGEMTYGAARGMKNFIMITLGTGVGSGIVINGEVVYGHDGFAGELGHTCAVRHNGRRCNCGKDGCLETYASATGVARTAREWLDMTDEPSLLRSLDVIKSKNVYEAAKEGDKLALRVFDYTGRILGEKFADFIEFSAPEAIVLFGGLARAREFLEEPIRKAMDENVIPLWRGKVKLVFSQLKESMAGRAGHDDEGVHQSVHPFCYQISPLALLGRDDKCHFERSPKGGVEKSTACTRWPRARRGRRPCSSRGRLRSRRHRRDPGRFPWR